MPICLDNTHISPNEYCHLNMTHTLVTHSNCRINLFVFHDLEIDNPYNGAEVFEHEYLMDWRI